ncbi:Kunitz trypsin inhibitor 5 [Citrus sinensis]|nr:Kunitz trypsin inhibitor 5 [Citrus sinensis]
MYLQPMGFTPSAITKIPTKSEITKLPLCCEITKIPSPVNGDLTSVNDDKKLRSDSSDLGESNGGGRDLPRAATAANRASQINPAGSVPKLRRNRRRRKQVLAASFQAQIASVLVGFRRRGQLGYDGRLPSFRSIQARPVRWPKMVEPSGSKSRVLGRGNAQPDPVLDISSKQLRAGSKYYILPVTKGRGGGLTLAGRSNNKTCPLDVVQEQHSFKNGFPVTFSPVNPKKGVVRESTDLNIKFDAATSCAQSTVWKLDNFDAAFGQWLVTTGGVEGNPGPRTMRNWFKIEKFFGDYKLVYCPSVCNFCRGLCRDVGIFINGGVRRLALSDIPFKVVFKKV